MVNLVCSEYQNSSVRSVCGFWVLLKYVCRKYLQIYELVRPSITATLVVLSAFLVAYEILF